MHHSALLRVYVTIAAVTKIAFGDEFLCDIPTAGCANGMFNQVSCSCDCIPPFCPDADGNCIVSGTCDDPWKDCERGKNCPWWANPLKAEACTTGPTIPEGTWKIFPSEEICCKANFPYSEFCTPATSPPTKYPTIALLEDDNEEIISFQFSAAGIPDTVPENSIKSEMGIVFKRILLRMAEKINGLKVTKVEAIKLSRNLRRQLLRESIRILSYEVTVYFHVYVVRDDDQKFGPYIINEIGDSYDDVLTQIQSYSDTKYLEDNNLDLNFCTLYDGEYSMCAKEERTTDVPSPVTAPSTTQTSSVVQPDTGDAGLAGWAIALIVVLVLSLVCCGGYAIAVLFFGVENFFKDQEDVKDIQKNAYMDERFGRTDSAKRLAILDGKSQSSMMQRTLNYPNSKQLTQGSRIYPDSLSGVQVVCSNPQYPAFDDTSFTINTYSTNRRQARDPTMFISGQDSKPDPGTTHSYSRASVRSSSRRYYSEEPSIKPQREPTMYMDGKAFDINPVLRQKRNPTLYDETVQRAAVENIPGSYLGESYKIEVIHEDEEYIRSHHDPKFRSEATSHDEPPSLFGSTRSNRTQEQSAYASCKSLKSKSSRKSDKHHDSI